MRLPALPARRVMALVLLAALLLLGGCGTTVVRYGADAGDLHGRVLLVLPAEPLEATPADLHTTVQSRLEAALTGSGQLQRVITAEAMRTHPKITPGLRGDYNLLSSTLSLTGVVSPEEAHRLSEGLGIDLFSQVELAYLPCPVCEEGDELWLTGLVVDARTGDLVFRGYYQTLAGDVEGLPDKVEGLTDDFLEDIVEAFTLKWHRERFKNLGKG